MPRIGFFDNPVTGYLGFCAVKYVGYTFAAHVLSRHLYREPRKSAFLVGGARTLIGMAAGAAYYGLNLSLGEALSSNGLATYLAGLFPIRIGEWWLLIWWFYDRQFKWKGRDWIVVLLATWWSYMCDFPATIGWLMTGGIFVC